MKFPFGHQLLHIYGPFAIQSYGFIIAIGVLVGMWLTTRNRRFTQLQLENSFVNIIFVSFFAAFIGGRILAIISEPHFFPTITDMFAFWEGGFSILGSIIGVLVLVPWYLKKINVPIIPFLDLIAIYAPLTQAISRIGCFAAGCCYGMPTDYIWSVTYTNPHTIAPLHTALHPTQLYSALILFLIFLFMYLFAQYAIKRPGYLLGLYLILASAERFFVDFFRGERISTSSIFSFNQLIALGIISITILVFIATTFYQINCKSSKCILKKNKYLCKKT